jgi:ArsR family transcriptional regulator
MNARTQARYETRARVIKAMGHPTRLFIVDELSRGERSVLDLTAKVGADVSTVSRHLAVLKGVDLVRAEKRGPQVFYSLRVPCVLDFFGCVDAVLKSKGRAATVCAR